MAMADARHFVNLVVLAGTLLLPVAHLQAAEKTQIPAFPGAEGFGAYAKGGRGGRVIEVTNLNTGGPGSLHAACLAKGPRIVVFRVSGVINRAPWIREPFITIAGQTAPGDGICLRNSPLIVVTHDVVIRHLRSRAGDNPIGRNAECRESIGISGKRARDVIVDHCSFSWSPDVNVITWGAHRNVTIQWCLATESLLDSIHQKGPHGKGMLLGSQDNALSVHHCLLAHNNGRNPLIGDTGNAKLKGPSVFDFRNNVIYNHGRAQHSCSNARGRVWINYVANFTKMRANANRNDPCGVRVYNDKGQAKVYAKDNIWPGMPQGEPGQVDNWLLVGRVLGPRHKPAPEALRARRPIPVPAVATQPAAQAYESVLKYAGCTRPVRDVVDARVIAEVRAGTGHIIDSQEDVGGYPTYASATPPADTDHDAMPDAWEKKYGFDVKDPADGPKDLDGDGYTNVEEFLNETDPAKPDTGAPVPQPPVLVQAGNDRIRGQAARKLGEQRLARLKTVNATRESYQQLLRKVRESGKEVADLLGIKFVKIPAGELTVGKVKARLTRPYELSACEITQKQWETVMGTRPWTGLAAAGDNPKFPVTYVNYLDCQEFVARLNALGSRKYRLPTYCEWRHAASGGTDSLFGFGADKKRIPEYAWCCVRFYDEKNRMVGKRFPELPTAVGSLKPNPWGLYDMAGNASEWGHDWYGYWTYRRGAVRTDPMGPKTGKLRITCGAHFRCVTAQFFRYPASMHRPHYRGFEMGFRLQRSLAQGGERK